MGYASRAQYERHKLTHPEEAEKHKAATVDFDKLPERVEKRAMARKATKVTSYPKMYPRAKGKTGGVRG